MKRYWIAIIVLLLFASTGRVYAKESVSSVTSDMPADELEEEQGSAPSGFLFGDEIAGKGIQDGLSAEINRLAESVNISYSIVDGVLTISGTGSMPDYKYSSLPEWYSSADTITEVVVDSGITRVGNFAFYGLKNLNKVTFSNTVTTIGEAAFYGCTALTNISLPATIVTLEDAAFAQCKQLESVEMPGVTSLGTYAFEACAIRSIEIPAGIKNLKNYVFFDARIETITVAEGNTVFSAIDGVLYSDAGKTLVLYPIGKTNVSFTIPTTVTKIGSGAFLRAKNLKEVNLNKVTALGESAFQESGLESLTIPDSVKEAEDFTFYGCNKLESVTFGKGMEITSYQMFRECSSLKKITFGSALKELYAHTFAMCYSLESVELPANIIKIGNGTFGNCSGLKSFKSNGLTSGIPYQAFWSCSKLENVTLNEGFDRLYRCSFYYCNSLKEITVPESVTYIQEMAFPKSTKITCKNKNMKPMGYNGYCLGDYVSITGENKYSYAYEVLELINAERSKAGIAPLVMEEELLDVAMMRAADTILLFSHTRPDGSTCMSASDKMYGENIAIGQTSAKEVVNSWMNSSGHKANIMNSEYTTIGIGCYYHNGVYSWVQCFGVEANVKEKSKPNDRNQTYKVLLASEEFEEAIIGTDVSFSFGGSDEPYKYEFVVSPENYCIGEKESTQLHVAVKNPGFSNYAFLDMAGLKFVSDNTKVATVSNAGLVTGVKKGVATVYMKLTGFQASTKIGVETDVENKDSVISSEKITVQLVAGKGTLYASTRYVEEGEKYGYLPSPKRKGYKFKGWYTKATKGKKVTKNTIVTNKKDHKLYAQWTKITVGKAAIKSAKVVNKIKVKITTKKLSGITGYQYMIATNSKFKKNVQKTFSIKKSHTFTKIKKNKTYYVRVRAYQVDSAGKKVYGKWSTVKKIR